MSSIGFLQAYVDKDTIQYPKINDNVTQYLSIGNLITLDNKNYILTCNHCIKNTIKHGFIFNDRHFNCSLKIYSDELELGLLEVHNMNIKCKPLDINELDMSIKTKLNDIKIVTLDIENFIDNESVEQVMMECYDYRMVYKKIESVNMPELPIIVLQINNELKIDVQGMSGSLIYSNDKVLGILSNVTNSGLNVIPSRNIYRFLTEFLKTNEFNGICTIVGQNNIINFETDSCDSINGIYIQTTYNINYNEYNYKEENVKCQNLKQDDIIFGIDNNTITENGTIYDKLLETYINYQSYIALNHICGNEIKLKIMRCTNIKTNDYTEKKISIRARPLNSMKYIPLVSYNNIFKYNGCVFGEINENIINEYLKIGINIGYSLKDYYINNPYRNDNIHVVVLLDIEKSSITDTLNDKLDSLGLPLLYIKDKEYSIPIIKKINKHKVTSLEKLKSILLKQERNIIYLDNGEIKTIKIHINKNKIDIQ